MGKSGEESNASMRTIRCRNARCNTAQLSAMVQFLSKNKDMTNGRVGGPSSSEQNAKWNEMATKLAKLGPAKSGSQWKMVWRDVKCKTKAKYKAMNDSCRTGAKRVMLSEHEKKVLQYLKYETTEPRCYMDEMKIKADVSPPPSPARSTLSDSDTVLSDIISTQKDTKPSSRVEEELTDVSTKLTAAGLRLQIDGIMKVEAERTNTMKEMSEAIKRLVEAQEVANQQNREFQHSIRDMLREIINRLAPHPAATPANTHNSNAHSGLGSNEWKSD